jgi:methyl-accepting chemotaxis protein
MLKNISVSAKGFVAFAILALIAISASSLIYVRAVTTTELVERNQNMALLREETVKISNDVTFANMALKNFLLTGNRDFVTVYEETSAVIDADIAKLEAMVAESAPDQASTVADVKTILTEWRTTVVDRQIALMRDPLTVELARVLELTGEGTNLLNAFDANMGSISGVIQERSLVAAEEQRAALSGVVFISLAASVIVAIVAGLMGLLNFRLVSRPLGRLADATARLADGDLDVTIDKGGKDEIGKMAESMQVFREAAIANKQLQADAEANRQQAEADRIAAQEKAEADAAERLKDCHIGSGNRPAAACGRRSFLPAGRSLRARFRGSAP